MGKRYLFFVYHQSKGERRANFNGAVIGKTIGSEKKKFQ